MSIGGIGLVTGLGEPKEELLFTPLSFVFFGKNALVGHGSAFEFGHRAAAEHFGELRAEF